MTQDRLHAQAMISIENKLVRDIPDFNKKVIEKFVNQREVKKACRFFPHIDALEHVYPQICISHGSIQNLTETFKLTDQRWLNE